METAPTISTARLQLAPFTRADVPALADILAEPEVTKGITANGSTPERCRASAEQRIAWHNSAWQELGYGTWAVRERDATADGRSALVGWCGFAEPDIGEDPEILYGLAPGFWGRGLASEAARAAIDWLFAETASAGVSAVIFARINPASVAIAEKLGMRRRGTMSMPDFISDFDLAKDVLDYEIWRLREGASRDPQALLFEAPFKAGQLASLDLADRHEIERTLCAAARGRPEFSDHEAAEVERQVREAFRAGLAEPELDWFHMPREGWAGAGRGAAR